MTDAPGSTERFTNRNARGGRGRPYGKRPRGSDVRPTWESRRGRPRRGGGPSQPKVPEKPKCSQCDVEDPKYKCPKCRATYCGVICCRTHKDKGCDNITQIEKQPVMITKSKYLPSDLLLRDPQKSASQRRNELEEDDDNDEELDEGWKITRTMMDAMDSSTWLRKELQDGGLRQIIYEIDCASNKVVKSGQTPQELALEQAKAKYPTFAAFLDKLLVLTGTLEREDTSDLAEWLEREDDCLGPLALVPIQRKVLPAALPPVDELQSEDSSTASSSDESKDSEEESESSSDDSE